MSITPIYCTNLDFGPAPPMKTRLVSVCAADKAAGYPAVAYSPAVVTSSDFCLPKYYTWVAVELSVSMATPQAKKHAKSSACSYL